MHVTFGVCADIHTEFMHDSVKRMQAFLDQCAKQKTEFGVSLGDFCPPGELNLAHKKEILSRLQNNPMPFYHILGNHDMDRNSKDAVCAWLNLDAPHSSFDCGGVHFILLDACFFKVGDNCFPYDHGNYTKTPGAVLPVLSPEELSWLEEDLKKTSYPSVIFTHQSLIESRAGIRNAKDFRNIIKKAPAGVILCIAGHEHVDRAEQKDGVWYVCLNSMSYYWAGHEYEHTTFGEPYETEFPLLRQVFPYRDPLYAIITVTDNCIRIEGTKSEIVGASPLELNFQKPGLVDPIVAQISDRTLPLSEK